MMGLKVPDRDSYFTAAALLFCITMWRVALTFSATSNYNEVNLSMIIMISGSVPKFGSTILCDCYLHTVVPRLPNYFEREHWSLHQFCLLLDLYPAPTKFICAAPQCAVLFCVAQIPFKQLPSAVAELPAKAPDPLSSFK